MILSIELTDTFDQWRQKDNEMITKVNALTSSGSVIVSTSPTDGQILLYHDGAYRNVTLSGDVTVASDGAVTVVSGGTGAAKGRLRYAGSMTSLY